jgi:hypothetical protein
MTVGDVIDSFRQLYPACPDALALRYFNDVNREFLMRSQARNKWEYIECVAGQSEYDAPDGIMQIHESYYMPSSNASSWFPLIDKSVDEKIVKEFGWMLTSQIESQPTQIYTTTATDGDSSILKIGVWMSPTTSATGGYPCIGMRVTSVSEMDANDDVYPMILNRNIYVWGMALLWCWDKNPEDAPRWEVKAPAEMAKNVEFIKGLQVHKNVEVLANATLRVSPKI